MPSLKDLKNRIGSVKNTRKITKAMQMVAAAKLRRAQDAAEQARPYAERMNAVMAGLASSVGKSSSAPRLLAGTGSDKVHLLVVMTAERGLCGGFNSSIARLARVHANQLLAQGKTVIFIAHKLPEVLTPAGDVQVEGRLAPPPSQLFELGAGSQGAIRQNVDLPALAKEWRVPLLEGVSVLQTGPLDTRLLRDWPRFVGDAHKHYGYAVQWFAMCAVTAALYLWFQIFLPRSRRRTHGTDPR